MVTADIIPRDDEIFIQKMVKIMAYVKIYKKWLPYALMKDQRGFISLRFGSRHTGIDSVGNQLNNPICAVINGTVLEVYTSETLGNVVKYGIGKIVIAYYHLAKIHVRVGQEVCAGKTLIGIEGSTGAVSKGKHLHTSVWIDGVLVDPEPYLSGTKQFPDEKDDLIMVRKVIRPDLNMRAGAGVGHMNYGKVPVGTLINPVETVKVGSAIWGKYTCTMADGKEHTGWSNLGDTWSKVYTGVVFEDDNSDKIAELTAQIKVLNDKISSVKEIVK